MMVGQQAGFPDCSLIAFPVANQTIDPPVVFPDPQSKGEPDGDWQSMSKRTRGSFYSRNLVAVWMATEWAAESSECVKEIARKELLLGKYCIQSERSMPFAENKTISFLPPGISRVVLEDSIVKNP
jgi:hypothetical protein